MAIDLGEEVVVKGVATQGRANSPGAYVSNFTVSASIDNVTWTSVLGAFLVERESLAKTLHPFGEDAVTARYLKFTVMDWEGSYVAMRAGVLIDASVQTRLSPLTICKVEEWIGGDVSLRMGADCMLTIPNPPVRFTPAHSDQPTKRAPLVFELVPPWRHVRQVGAGWRGRLDRSQGHQPILTFLQQQRARSRMDGD